jgi:2-dehydropantoate 2-reductase
MTEPRARTYTVVGAGAVGLLYGVRLAVAGHRVRWLVRSGAEEIRRDGIEVSSDGEVLRIPAAGIEVATDPRDLAPSDVVLLATKTTAGGAVDPLVRRACAAGGTIVVLQNGLGAEERLREAVPEAHAVLGGLCFVCAHRLGPGRAEHLDYGAVTLAPLDPQHDEAAAAVASDLRAGGVETTVLDDLALARWRKLVWNIPFNGLCTVLDTSTDHLLADRSTRALVADLMDEVIEASQAVGHPVPAAFRDEMLATTDAMRPYDPSMKLDRAAGRPLEIGAIYDAAIAAAAAAGHPMRRVEALAAMLRFLDPAGG